MKTGKIINNLKSDFQAIEPKINSQKRATVKFSV
jgi:hypothetical protein